MPCLANWPCGDLDLAAPADAATAADRVEIGAEFSGRLEHRRAVGEVAALAGGGEDDEALRHHPSTPPAFDQPAEALGVVSRVE